jgi:hypothetical protein
MLYDDLFHDATDWSLKITILHSENVLEKSSAPNLNVFSASDSRQNPLAIWYVILMPRSNLARYKYQADAILFQQDYCDKRQVALIRYAGN